jgi:hypothetical protein
MSQVGTKGSGPTTRLDSNPDHLPLALAGLDPAIHVFRLKRLQTKTWASASSPGEAKK